MKKTLFTMITVAAIALAGCKKDSSNKPSSLTSDSFWPVTSGNSWTYKDVSPAGTSNLSMKMTGSTSTINNKTYYVITSLKGGTNFTNYFMKVVTFTIFAARSSALQSV